MGLWGVESDLRKQLRLEMTKKKKSGLDEDKIGKFDGLHRNEKKNDILQVLINAQTHSIMSEHESHRNKGKVTKSLHF